MWWEQSWRILWSWGRHDLTRVGWKGRGRHRDGLRIETRGKEPRGRKQKRGDACKEGMSGPGKGGSVRGLLGRRREERAAWQGFARLVEVELDGASLFEVNLVSVPRGTGLWDRSAFWRDRATRWMVTGQLELNNELDPSTKHKARNHHPPIPPELQRPTNEPGKISATITELLKTADNSNKIGKKKKCVSNLLSTFQHLPPSPLSRSQSDHIPRKSTFGCSYPWIESGKSSSIPRRSKNKSVLSGRTSFQPDRAEDCLKDLPSRNRLIIYLNLNQPTPNQDHHSTPHSNLKKKAIMSRWNPRQDLYIYYMQFAIQPTSTQARHLIRITFPQNKLIYTSLSSPPIDPWRLEKRTKSISQTSLL